MMLENRKRIFSVWHLGSQEEEKKQTTTEREVTEEEVVVVVGVRSGWTD